MPLDPRTDEKRQLEHVKEDLKREFASVPAKEIDEAFARIVGGYSKASVRSFVPVLAQREARQLLRQHA